MTKHTTRKTSLIISTALFSLVSVLCLATLTACVGTLESNHVLTNPARAAHTGEVAIYMKGMDAPAQYLEIGLVQTIASNGYANMADVIEDMKTEARALGCNALINVHIDQGGSNASGNGVCVLIH